MLYQENKRPVSWYFCGLVIFFLMLFGCLSDKSPVGPTETFLSPIETVNPVPGISVWFYQGNGAIAGRYPTLLAVFETVTVYSRLDPYDTTRADSYTGGPGVVIYKGLITIPTDGDYNFSVVSNNTTQLTIHGQSRDVLDTLKLKEGFHDFIISVRGDSSAQEVHFSYALAGNALMPVPKSMLFHESEGANDRYNNFSRFFTPQTGTGYFTGDTLDIYFAANPDSLNTIYFSFSPDNGLRYSRITNSSNNYGYPNWGHAKWFVPDSVSYYSEKIPTVSVDCILLMHNYSFDIMTGMDGVFIIGNRLK